MSSFLRNLSFVVFLAVILCGGWTPATVHADCNIFGFNCDQEVPYCEPGTNECTLAGGVDIVDNNIDALVKNQSFSQYVQSVVAYLLGFLGIVGVLYIIYAGVRILTSAGDDEAVSESRKTILYVAIGLVVIFLAYPIVIFIIGDGQDNEGILGAGAISRAIHELLPTAYAVERGEVGTWAEYQDRMKALGTTLFITDFQGKGRFNPARLTEMRRLITESFTVLPDNQISANNSYYQSALSAVELVIRKPDSDAGASNLAKALQGYLESVKIGRITAKISKTPDGGNAPLVVSLRATEARDPSGIQIPNQNFIWYVKTPRGGRQEIGRGPNISATFTDEKRQTVFLEILSASRNSKNRVDVLPFEGSTEIDVLPRIVNLYLNINGTNVTNANVYKVSPELARAGLVIDATASQPSTGTQFVSTKWIFGNGNDTERNGGPQLEREIYANQGTYELTLEMKTNRGDTFTKRLQIIVKSPAAIINTDKTVGYTRDTIAFNAVNAYTLQNPVYLWDIIYLGTDETPATETVYRSQMPNISYKFVKTGLYSVKLTTQLPNGTSDTDARAIRIESREPIASFNQSQPNSEAPNVYRFDATQSYDPDTFSNDKLTFVWTIDGQVTELINPQRNSAIGLYRFDSVGTHQVSLDVTNEAGKTTTVTQTINVTSTLAVALTPTPVVTQVGKTVELVAEASASDSYEWRISDGTTEITTNNRYSHVFKQAGIFDVAVTVRSNVNGKLESNTATRKVYISNANSPIAVISLKREVDTLLPTPWECENEEAFVIDRARVITLWADQSLNVDGRSEGLTYQWSYLGNTTSQRSFTYKFDELGCFPVSLKVRSEKTGVASDMRVFVKVVNLAPSVSSITIAETSKAGSDPIVLTVTANNARDEDGAITSYLWYYSTDNDPEPQDFRITNSATTTFVIPRITGKYQFFVTLEDSNGLKINSGDILSNNPATFTVVAETDINTPLVELKLPKTNFSVGDEAIFSASARNIAGVDLSSKDGIEYKWDFDGDGFYDETSISGRMKHVYDVPGDFNMKVKVTYRGVSNTRYQRIVVKNDLKPDFEVIAVGNKFILVNTSIGTVAETKWSIEGVSDIGTNRDSFTFDASNLEEIPTEATLEVFDGRERKSVSKELVANPGILRRIERSTEAIQILSLPEIVEDTITIKDGRSRITLYLGESKGAVKYAIDTDTAIDTDLNGSPDDDADNKGTDSIATGSPYTFIAPETWSTNGTIRVLIYNANDELIDSQILSVTMLTPNAVTVPDATDEAITGSGITESDRIKIEEIKDIIRTSAEQYRLQLMKYVSQLQESWNDPREKTQTIVDFQTYIDTLPIETDIKDSLILKLDAILQDQNETQDEVSLAATVIRNLVPIASPAREVVERNLTEILSHPTNQTLNKTLADEIWASIKADENISTKDKETIGYQLKVITNGTEVALEEVPEPAQTSAGLLSKIKGSMRIVLIVLAAVIGIAIIIAVIGYILSKVRNKKDQTGFQDYVIDTLSGNVHTKAPEVPKEVVPEVKKPDLMSGSTAIKPPVEKMKAPENIKPLPTTSEAPDWLKAATTLPTPVAKSPEAPISIITESKPVKKEVPPTLAVPPSNEVPAWLKATPSEPVKKENTPPAEELTVSDTTPAWLKGIDLEATKKESEELMSKKELLPSTDSMLEEVKSLEPKAEELMKKPSPEVSIDSNPGVIDIPPASAPVTPASNTPPPANLPDWLKA